MSKDDKKYSNPLKRYFILRFLKKILKAISICNVKSILDIGCGEGYVDSYIFSKVSKIKILGIDSNSDLLKIAKKKNPKGKYRIGNIYHLSNFKEDFDLILVTEVLEHLQFPFKAICEISKRFNFIIYTVPNEPWFSILSFFSGRYWKTFGKHPDHINFWSKDSFNKFLLQVYSNVKIVSSFPWIIAICKK